MSRDHVQIGLTGIELRARIGVSAQERAAQRPIVVDVHVRPEVVAASRTDELDDTVDYAAIAGVVRRVAAETEYRLLERLATALCDEIWSRFPLRELEVTVHKPAPPVEITVADAWVRVSRRA